MSDNNLCFYKIRKIRQHTQRFVHNIRASEIHSSCKFDSAESPVLWVAIAVLTEFTENWYQSYTLPKSFSVRVDITEFTDLTET